MTARLAKPSISLLAVVVTGIGLASIPAGAMALSAPAAIAAPPQANAGTLALYRQLMEVNGVAQNVRQAVADTRKSTLEALVVDKGRTLTSEESGQFEAVSKTAFDPLPEQILNMIATRQAATFTPAELRGLIAAESGPTVAAYVASTKTFPSDYRDKVQGHLVDAVVGIIQAFRAAATIDDLPAYVSDGSPLENRIAKARRLMALDGAEEGTRQTVVSTYMPTIVVEVGKYIDFASLNEADRTRLATMVAQTSARLGSQIVALDARRHAAALTDEQLTSLITARNTPARRKLVGVLLDPSSDVDERTGQMLRAAVDQVAQAFGVPS